MIGKLPENIEQNQIYKCNVCGNIVEVLHVGVGELVCCGQPMELLKEKTEDVGQEKHIPVIEKTETGIKVRVGSVPHPMEERHYIEWVVLITDGRVYRKFLRPGDNPEAEFEIKAERIEAREYCNIHGLWKSWK
ncbi:MAG: desulfoferrodoxin [Methanosarcinales archaeon Met12]|nr:MAG: desulfoferrodoxin [Methanosarcinales archaeon Met12]